MDKEKTMPEKEQRSNKLKVEVRASGDGADQKKKITGYAVKWDQLSDPIWGYFQERFRKGAFANYLKGSPDVIGDWQHDMSEIMGRTAAGTLTVEEDDVGLKYEIDPPAWAENHVESIERGDVTGSSFIFRALKTEWDDTDPDMEIRTVIEAELIEVSPVTWPAYPQSEAGVRSAQNILESHAAEIKAAHNKGNQEIINLRRKRLDTISKL